MITTRNLLTLLVLPAVALSLTGCGGEQLPPGMPPPVPTEIVVIQEGNPLEGAVVRLQPADNSPWTAVGRTDASGRAIVYTMDRFRGAVPGQYKVIVSKTETETLDPTLTPDELRARDTTLSSFFLVEERFMSASTTPLDIEVVRGTRTHAVDVGSAVRILIDERR